MGKFWLCQISAETERCRMTHRKSRAIIQEEKKEKAFQKALTGVVRCFVFVVFFFFLNQHASILTHMREVKSSQELNP